MKPADWFTTERVAATIHRITEQPYVDTANMYLFIGEEKDLLVDTGTGLRDIAPVIRERTEHPVTVVNTHAHFDHCGGNAAFDTVHAHPDAAEILQDPDADGTASDHLDPTDIDAAVDLDGYSVPAVSDVIPVTDGDSIVAGSGAFRVIHMPGHSPGGICLYDEERGILVTGDTIYRGELLWALPGSDVAAYRDSLERLVDLSPELVLPGHNAAMTGDAMQELVRDALAAVPDRGDG